MAVKEPPMIRMNEFAIKSEGKQGKSKSSFFHVLSCGLPLCVALIQGASSSPHII